MQRALAILTRRPQKIWLEFLSTFKIYDIFLVIDDSSDYSILQKEYPTVRFIQIDPTECKVLGFTDFAYSPPDRKPVVAWEKALFYFSRLNTTYDQIWFFEDDVFFYSEETIQEIDKTYETSDVLTSPWTEHKTAPKNVWAWGKMEFRFSLPYYTAMVCACRISKEVLEEIRLYAKKYKTLVLHEAMVPTIAKKRGKEYSTPEELTSIVYRKEWNQEEITRRNLYHPIKDLQLHETIRARLKIDLNSNE